MATEFNASVQPSLMNIGWILLRACVSVRQLSLCRTFEYIKEVIKKVIGCHTQKYCIGGSQLCSGTRVNIAIEDLNN